ncbi:MAG TPA: VOC family protein [Catenuloplanes sp.]|jgi:hypothetical protein
MSGRVVHFEIPADDVDRARAFYRDVFGWSISAMPGMDYSILSTAVTDENGMPKEPGAINGGMMPRQGPITSPVVVIETDSIDAALPQIEQRGGKVAIAKLPVGDMGFAAYFTDPEGNIVGLWENAAK